jgi:hypothetical protein
LKFTHKVRDNKRQAILDLVEKCGYIAKCVFIPYSACEIVTISIASWGIV